MDIKYIPAHIIRLYVWELLQDNAGLTEVNGLIPILPFEEEPKVVNSGKTYLVYGYADNESNRIEQIRRGAVSFRVVTTSSNELAKILNIMSTAFESRDVITESVNLWSSAFPGGAFLGVRFTELYTSYVEGGEPADTEAGPVDGVINISYLYVRENNLSIPGSGGLWTP